MADKHSLQASEKPFIYTTGRLLSWMSALPRYLIKGYMLAISPILGTNCRFYPSCSRYALDAVEAFGFWKGTWLTTVRLLRCQPLCDPGVDFVPEKFAWFPAKNPVDYHADDTSVCKGCN